MQNLSYGNEFYLDVNETHFHMKGYAPSLALKKRYKTTRKWLNKYHFFDFTTLTEKARTLFIN